MTHTLTAVPGKDSTAEEGLMRAELGLVNTYSQWTQLWPWALLVQEPLPWWFREWGLLCSFLIVDDQVLGPGWSLVSELGSMYTPLHPGEQDRVVQSGSTLWSMKGRKTGWEEGWPRTDEEQGANRAFDSLWPLSIIKQYTLSWTLLNTTEN